MHRGAQRLPVDITVSGTYDDFADLTPGTIAAGTQVSSHFIHTDPVAKTKAFYDGTVTVDTDIIGLAVKTKTLNATDVLGAPGTAYPTKNRAVNLDTQQPDSITLEADRRTVHLHVRTKGHVDQVRIITACDHGGGGQGCSPGYWKQSHHFDSWQVYAPTDSFETVFGVDAFPGDPTLVDVLSQGGGQVNALGRQAVAGCSPPCTRTSTIR